MKDGFCSYCKGEIKMGKQFIVSIGREYGCGGHDIANKIAEIFNIKCYGSNMLEEIAKEKGTSVEELAKFDEKPRNVLFSRSVGEFTNSMEKSVAQMEFDFMKKKVAEGESFVVVGRCSDEVLDDENVDIVAVFINGDPEDRIDRISKGLNISRGDAEDKMEQADKKRRAYHDALCKADWGDADSYDICLNSSKIGIEKTVEMLEQYINIRLAM